MLLRTSNALSVNVWTYRGLFYQQSTQLTQSPNLWTFMVSSVRLYNSLKTVSKALLNNCLPSCILNRRSHKNLCRTSFRQRLIFTYEGISTQVALLLLIQLLQFHFLLDIHGHSLPRMRFCPCSTSIPNTNVKYVM